MYVYYVYVVYILPLGAPPSIALDNGGDGNCQFLGFDHISKLFDSTGKHIRPIASWWAVIGLQSRVTTSYDKLRCTITLHRRYSLLFQFTGSLLYNYRSMIMLTRYSLLTVTDPKFCCWNWVSVHCQYVTVSSFLQVKLIPDWICSQISLRYLLCDPDHFRYPWLLTNRPIKWASWSHHAPVYLCCL